MSVAGIEPIAEPNLQNSEAEVKPEIAERVWGLEARVDESVTFEEYAYWAKIERADEHERNRQYVEKRGPLSVAKILKGRFSHGIHHEEKKEQEKAVQMVAGAEDNQKGGIMTVNDSSSLSVTDEEWKTAARALKTASWGTVFFLITTDILGWGSCPYVLTVAGRCSLDSADPMPI